MSASARWRSGIAAVGWTTSPATISHPSAASAAARDGSRTRAVTASPRVRSARVTAPMTKPVAPVTKTLIGEYSRASTRSTTAARPREKQMNVAIIGAGNVGGALAASTVRAGHKVTLSAKNPAHADAKAKETGARAVRSATDAVTAADVVILAVPYAAVDSVLDELGETIAGKVLIDVTNRMKRDSMSESVDGTSAAEHIQEKAPKAKVAKAFNYAFASKQADPKADGQSIDGYVAADDADAKSTTLELARSIGL